MTIEEIKSQLYEMIDERRALMSSGDCDVIDNAIYSKDIAALKAAIEAVQFVDDTANAEEPTAHWDIACGSYTPFCSNCGEEPPAYTMTAYCPHCGSKMVTRGDNDD